MHPAVLALLLAAGCGAGPVLVAARSLNQMTTMMVAPERMAPSAEAAGRAAAGGGQPAAAEELLPQPVLAYRPCAPCMTLETSASPMCEPRQS